MQIKCWPATHFQPQPFTSSPCIVQGGYTMPLAQGLVSKDGRQHAGSATLLIFMTPTPAPALPYPALPVGPQQRWKAHRSATDTAPRVIGCCAWVHSHPMYPNAAACSCQPCHCRSRPHPRRLPEARCRQRARSWPGRARAPSAPRSARRRRRPRPRPWRPPRARRQPRPHSRRPPRARRRRRATAGTRA